MDKERQYTVPQTEVVGAHRELEVILGVESLWVLQVQHQSSVVDQNRQLLAASSETAHKRPY